MIVGSPTIAQNQVLIRPAKRPSVSSTRGRLRAPVPAAAALAIALLRRKYGNSAMHGAPCDLKRTSFDDHARSESADPGASIADGPRSGNGAGVSRLPPRSRFAP